MIFLAIENPIDTIGMFCDYIIHPAKILWALWTSTVQLSLILCLTLCLAAVLLNIFGFRKYSKWAPASIAIYTVIQSINSALR